MPTDHVQVALGQGEEAPLQYVDLAAVEELDAEEAPGSVLQGGEVDRVAGAGDAGAVLGKAQELQALLRGGLGHLPVGAEGVAAVDGVGVDVQFKGWEHGRPPWE